MRSRMEEEGYTIEALIDSTSILSLARTLKVKAAVLGSISSGDGDQLKVTVVAIRVKDGKRIGSVDATIQITDQIAKLRR
jgi:hypothetical protein